MPHDEEALSSLVNVHIVGSDKELVDHLQGATMRVKVVLSLISELRKTGYPGYTAKVNSEDAVQKRMKELYEDKYGAGPFVPAMLRDAAEKAHRARLQGTSLIFDKNATPAEPSQDLHSFETTARPQSLVAQRSGAGTAPTHEHHERMLAKFQTLQVTAGNTMLDNSFLSTWA